MKINQHVLHLQTTALLKDAGLLKFLWLLALNHVIYFKNQILLQRLENIIFLEKCFDKKLNLKHLWIWSSVIYYHIFKKKHIKSEKFIIRDKLEYLVDFDLNSYSTKIVKIWKSDFRQVFKEWDVDIVKISNKFDDKDSSEDSYNEEDSSAIWNFHDSLKNDHIIDQNNNSNEKKLSEAQWQLTEEIISNLTQKKQEQLLWELQESCSDDNNSQHLISEKKNDNWHEWAARSDQIIEDSIDSIQKKFI